MTSKNIYTEIDEADFELLATKKMHACKQRTGGYYIYTYFNKKSVPLHRFLLNMPDSKYDVDHINGIKTDNRRSNLRLATRSQNQANKVSKIGTSSFKGVCFERNTKKWKAYIEKKQNGKRKCITGGRFNTEIEAAIKYNELAIDLFGQYAKINNITGGGLSPEKHAF